MQRNKVFFKNRIPLIASMFLTLHLNFNENAFYAYRQFMTENDDDKYYEGKNITRIYT